MSKLLRKRWLWITALFAAINVVGLYQIHSALNRQRVELTVESFSPEETASPSDVISVRFDQPMVPAEQVGKAAPLEYFSLSPSVRGELVWRDTRTLAFEPAQPLSLATPYVATVSRDCRSLLGHALAKDHVFPFCTPALELEAIRQASLSRDGEVTLALDFSDQVVPDEVARHLSLAAPSGKSVRCTLESRVPARHVVVRTHPFREEALTVTVAKGLRGTSGPLGLEEDRTETVRIDTGLRIGQVNGSAPAPGNVCLSVECTQRVDTGKAAKFIQVEPEVNFSVTSTYSGFNLTGPFLPGKRYRLTFLKGLSGGNGAFLTKDTARSVTVPDYNPSLRFKTQGIYLSAQGNLLLPLECVNVKEADFRVEQIYDNNIVLYMREADTYRPLGDLGRELFAAKYAFEGKPNDVHLRNIDLKELLGPEPQGVYLASATDSKSSWKRDQKLILITDLGLTVKRSEDDLLVWVNALSTASPVAGAAISLFTRTNQKTLTGTTDERGIAHFKDVDWSGDRRPFAAVATKGKDTAFIDLGTTEIDGSELATGGRPYLRKGYEAFVYSDRGIYRPGSKVVLRALVRGPGLAVPTPFPVQFRIARPDGRLFKTLPAKLSQWGSAEAELDVPRYALTGHYTAELRLPNAKEGIGSHSFQVEEFVPDRMKMEIVAEARRYKAGEEITFTVKAHHLFGAPAAGRRVEARCDFVPSSFAHPDWPGYQFGDAERKFARATESLGEATLDEKGEKTFTVKIPTDLAPPSAAAALITASVKEVGGRAISAGLRREVDPYPCYVGLARESKDYAAVGKEERLLCAVVGPDGTLVPAAELEGQVFRIVWNTILKVDDEGRYRYVSERQEEPLERLACSVKDGRGAVAVKPPDYGQYVVRLRDPKSGASAALSFYCAGEGYVPWAMEKPDTLELVADKEAYAPGDTAVVLVKAPFAGQALFTVESDRIHLAQTVAMEANTAEFRFPVDPAFGPNVYCTATVVRKVTPQGKWAAHRAFGAVPILLDNGPHRLQVEVEAAGETRPGRPLKVALRVHDAAGAGRKAEVTLAAVDEGICQLTRYQTPDPWGFFFAQRRLGVATSDVYALLMPEVEKKKVGSDSATGGDGGGADYDPRLFNPVSVDRVKQVALWKSGIETGEDGRAEVVIDVPDFNGQLRLMAVAASTSDFGTAERPALVKQPLMIRATFPRVLAPGDEFLVPVTIFNNTSAGGAVELKTEASGGMEILSDGPDRAEVEAAREKTVLLSARAPAAPGPASIRITATLGDETAAESVDIAVRPPATLQFVSGSGSIPAGQTARLTLPGKWVAKTDKYSLSLSPLPTLKLGASLKYLVHYPYGCVEQTTSSSFPLLYLGDVAKLVDPDAFDNEEVQSFVQAGIDRLLSMQTYNGGFGYWPGYGEVYPWGSAYATHFLVEARKAGPSVPSDSLDAALDYLEGMLNDDVETATKAYACFVLALAGRPNASWTYRLYEERDGLPAYSRFHVAAALALMKEQKLVDTIVGGAKLPEPSARRDTGGLLHSSTREAAILLSVYLDTAPEHPNVPLLVKRLDAAVTDDRWGTTQENAFAVMALGKYARRLGGEKADFKGVVSVGGRQLASFTSKDGAVLKPEGVGGKEIEVATEGTGTVYYWWGAEGIPLSGKIPEKDEGLRVRRRFLSRDGKPLDPRQIPHGEVLVVEISVRNDAPVQNLVINDLLPAGLEIENPRIATSEKMPWSNGGSEGDLAPDRVERRDDRLILFADIGSAGTRIHRYLARAVTRGRFALPAINAFAMYDPAISSVNGAGTLEVVGKE